MELLREEVLLAVPAGHRLAGREDVAVAERAGEPFLAPGPGHWQRELADRLFARAGLRPAVVCEGNEPGALLGMAGAGPGVALLPAMAREAGPRTAVAWARPASPDSRRVLWPVRDRDAFAPAAVRDFTDFAVAHFRGDG